MADSFDLQEEVQSLADIKNYDFPSYDVTAGDFEARLEAAIEWVASSSDKIFDTLDVFRSVLKQAEFTDSGMMSKALDSLTSGLQAELETTVADEQEDTDVLMQHRRNLEIYVFLISWFATAMDRTAKSDDPATPMPKGKKGKGAKAGKAATSKAKKGETAWSWIDSIPSTLKLLGNVMKGLHRVALKMWTTAERETFVGCVVLLFCFLALRPC